MRRSIAWRMSGLALIFLSFSVGYAQPQLSSPSNGAQNQQVTLTLSWQTVNGAAGFYDVEVATSSDLSGSTVVYQILSRGLTQPVLRLSNGKSFYWSARGDGTTGPWASAWRFSTVALAPGTPIAPVLSSPSNGFVDPKGISFLTLSWHSVSSATSYGLQVTGDSTFVSFGINNSINKSGITSIYSSSDSIEYIGIFYWRVNASNAVGTGPWSSSWRYKLPGDAVLPAIKQIKLRPTSNNFRLGFTKLLAHAKNIEAYSLEGEKMNSELLSRTNGVVIYRNAPVAGHE